MDTEKTQKRNYELAFHINQNTEQANAIQIKEEIESFITSNGGVIGFSKLPEKTHLSYLINHEHGSYFSYIQFSSENSDMLPAIDEQLRLNNNVIRHIVIRLEDDSQKRKAAVKIAKHKERKGIKQKEKQIETVTESKQLEKQLEEIISEL